jgi:hypothetical protein
LQVAGAGLADRRRTADRFTSVGLYSVDDVYLIQLGFVLLLTVFFS